MIGALAHAGDLDPLAPVGLTGVLLVRELDVEADDAGVQPFRGGELRGDVVPEVVRDLHVAAFDDDVHAASSCGQGRGTNDGSRYCSARGRSCRSSVRCGPGTRPTPRR
jgi:hypothetical protein